MNFAVGEGEKRPLKPRLEVKTTRGRENLINRDLHVVPNLINSLFAHVKLFDQIVLFLYKSIHIMKS